MKKRVLIFSLIALCLVMPISRVKARDAETMCFTKLKESVVNSNKWEKTSCWWPKVNELDTDSTRSGYGTKISSTAVCEYSLTAYDNKNVYIRLFASDPKSSNPSSQGILAGCAILEDGGELIYDKNFSLIAASGWTEGEKTVVDYWGGLKEKDYDYSKQIINGPLFVRNAQLGYYNYYYRISIGPRSGYAYSQSDCPTVTLNKVSYDYAPRSCLGNAEELFSSEIDITPYASPEDPETVLNPIINPTTTAHFGKIINVIYIVGVALLIIRIIVPILLIIMGMVGLVKAMTQNDDRDIKKEIMKLIPKVIAAIIIFILPTLVALLMKLVGNNSIWSTYSKCLLRPTTCNVDLWSK